MSASHNGGGRPVEIRDVNHWFTARSPEGSVQALDGISIDIHAGEFAAIVGPSGCGKTTLLNMVGGLLRPSEGTVLVGPSGPVAGAAELGYLFARDSLLPWRTAARNVGLPLELRGVERRERERRVGEMLEAVALSDFADAYPSQLSQGMRQRVALARTLVGEPTTLLMDEPFSALDAQTRLLMHEQFLRLWEQHKRTVMFITHDLAEAITLADRVLVFSRRPGRVKAEFNVDLPRPRYVGDLQGSSHYHELFQRIWGVFEEEVLDTNGKPTTTPEAREE